MIDGEGGTEKQVDVDDKESVAEGAAEAVAVTRKESPTLILSGIPEIVIDLAMMTGTGNLVT